ncbi:MAG: ERCC4 domain-containing protein, partial [Candidatus Dormibacteraceae bacterium]
MSPELLIARNPDPQSTLHYLLLVPHGSGLVFRTSGTWPRTKALYCHAMLREDWPSEPEIVERVPVRSCSRRGAAIDLVLDRGREHRSQIVYTHSRGRETIFWQSARTRKQARPQVSVPTARASGIDELEILVDAHERYAYSFKGQQARTVRRGLPCGDYGVALEGRLVASVERKSIGDLIGSVTDGRLRFALGELSALPRAAVVVEERFSELFKARYLRPAIVVDGLAELQVRWPEVPIIFCETRPLAEEWTYRFLAAARTWAETEAAAESRIGAVAPRLRVVPALRVVPPRRPGAPAPGEVRAWAREQGLPVSH